MKTSVLPITAFLAALAAVILLPVGATTACLAFTATGVLAVFLADYGRPVEPIRVPTSVVPFKSPCLQQGQLDEAA